MNARQSNLAMVETVARCFGELREHIVFLGGAVTALLLTDPAAPAIRATRDVDVLVEVGSQAEYYRLEKQLRALGFRNEPEVICRWRIAEVLVDVMPTDGKILGFSNRWYPAAIRHAWEVRLASDLSIRLIAPVYFLATKIEAFEGRGQGDFLLSHDLEDMVTVVDGRPEIVAEAQSADADVRLYLREKIGGLLTNPRFLEAIPAYLAPDEASQARYPMLIECLRQLAD